MVEFVFRDKKTLKCKVECKSVDHRQEVTSNVFAAHGRRIALLILASSYLIEDKTHTKMTACLIFTRTSILYKCQTLSSLVIFIANCKSKTVGEKP